MSRLENFQEACAENNKNGGMNKDQWIMFLLTDIAISLATISDAMTDGGESDES